jgi:phage gp36-like protein
MGTYITKTWLLANKIFREDDLVALTDDNDVGEIDDAVLDGAIARAEGTFASYAAAKYDLPIDLDDYPDVAGTVRGVLVALVTYYLNAPPRRQGNLDAIRTQYDDAMRWLRDLAKGDVTLGSVPAPPASGESGHVVSGGQPRRTGDGSENVF